jgi:predicted HicB family RNase H-like nuclease
MKDKKKATKTKAGKAATNGAPEVQPAPKNGPNLTLRMRSDAQIKRVKAAAGKAGMSMNTWACEVLDRASAAG